MLDFSKTITYKSEIRAVEKDDTPEVALTRPLSYPDVSYVVKRLSVVERATREYSIADGRSEQEDLASELSALGDEKNDTPAAAKQRRDIKRRIAVLLNRIIKPAVLEAGLVEVRGLTLDGSPMTVEQFVSVADDLLVDEAYILCELASKFPMEFLKNLQSPGTSPAVAPGTTSSSTAEPVGDAATT